MKRREFIFKTAAATTAAIVLPNIWGCEKKDDPAPLPYFRYLEVSGTHYEIGKQIGSNFKNEIIESHAGIKGYLDMANGIVQSAPDIFYDPFVEAAENMFPDYVEELQGIADGSALTFKEIFISNAFMEIVYLAMEMQEKKYPLPFGNLGCSSVAYSKNGKHFLAHNEDLFSCFLNNMYLIKISVPGKPQILNLSYPGMLPGIPPAMNEAGIVQCGNDICGLHIEQSVPLVFHFRSVLDASSLDDAISRASIPQRSRTMTHNIGSLDEQKIVSVEAAPAKNHKHEVDGFYVHTNHFIQADMLDVDIDPNTLGSSKSRFDVLTSESEQFADKPDDINSALFTEFLSSHDGVFSPCAHEHEGAGTLAHAVFDFETRDMKIYYSTPCLGNEKTYSI